MKLIDTLNEALGVPANIVESSKYIYEKLLNSKIEYTLITDNDFDYDTDKNQISFVGDIKIGDELYSKVIFYLKVRPHEKAKFVEIVGLSLVGDIKKVRNKLINVKSDVITITIDFVCPGKMDGNDIEPTISDKNIKEGIKKILINDKDKVISSFSHELKHKYDNDKKQNIDVLELSSYAIKKELIGMPVKPMHNFSFYLYFISVTETLVRPSELSALIQTKQITKQNFLNFIKDNDTYKTLNDIKNFKYEDFYRDLFNYIEYIKPMIPREKIVNKSDEEIVDIFLTGVREFLQNQTSARISGYLSDAFSQFSEMIGFSIGNPVVKKLKNKIFKYNNNEDFYRSEILYMNKAADFSIRKIAKIYDMAF